MQALSSYNPEEQAAVAQVLADLTNPAQGLRAETLLTPQGYFARFVWPDWPLKLSHELHEQIRKLHHLGLRDIGPDDRAWDSAFHGWRSDSDSAQAIYDALSAHLRGRVLWIESQRDTRGRIEAKASVQELGVIAFSLSWRNSSAVPPARFSESDLGAFFSSVQEVFDWAARRIRTVLDTLNARLQPLYGERFKGLYVFGSYARPDAGIELPIDSDLDVALILSDFDSPFDERERFGDIVYDLSLEHGLAISLVPLCEADFRQGRTNFTRVISEYAIPAK